MSVRIMILSGDYWHPSAVIDKGFNAAFSLKEYRVHYCNNPGQILWDRLGEFDVFVLAQWGRINHDQQGAENRWMDTALQQVVETYVKQGGGLFVLHSGLADHDQNGPLRMAAKGYFIHHPQSNPIIEITPSQADHPILQGVEAFTITDEQYFVHFDHRDTTLLLNGRSKEYGACAAAWAHPWGDGRVFCLKPGHTEEVLMHPMMRRLIHNGARWCAGE